MGAGDGGGLKGSSIDHALCIGTNVQGDDGDDMRQRRSERVTPSEGATASAGDKSEHEVCPRPRLSVETD